MNYLDEEDAPRVRPTFLTVLCILTFIGSGWAVFSSLTAYNTADKTVAKFSDTVFVENSSGKTVVIVDSAGAPRQESSRYDSLVPESGGEAKLGADSLSKDSIEEVIVDREEGSDKDRKAFEDVFGEKMKNNILDMMSVDKLKNSAIGSFIAALFTLSGAVFMWRLRRFGFYLYIAGIIIGIVIPFYIYGNNLLAIGLSAFSSFFGLIFIALYALNLKSMK